MHAFRRVVMPLAREYDPDIVLVSAGFDAAMGDELGECNVTPDGFARMTRMLAGLASGRIALALEGGYVRVWVFMVKVLHTCAAGLRCSVREGACGVEQRR